MLHKFYANLAHNDFEQARRKAFFRGLFSRLTGKKNDLLSLNDLPRDLSHQGTRNLGLQSVLINKILGSEGRYQEFDKGFYPRRFSTRDRWIRVDLAHYEEVQLPPVELLKVGEIYFVRDGNHRISVARTWGQHYVDAFVTEIKLGKETNNETVNAIHN